jgi:type IV pilus assembly protein PilF
MLAACVSEPAEKGFQGTGDFDKVEAAKTRVSLGLTYLKNGNFSQAKFNLDKALEFDPRSGQANFAMAFYYQQVDEVARAHEYYKQAIKLSRNDPDILNSYGAFLCKQGDYKQAKEYFLEAVDDKSYVSAAETYENLAICSESQGKVDEALAYFNSALNHQPTRTTSLLYLAQLYTQTGQWEEAKKALWKYERNASVSADSLWLSFQIAKGESDVNGAKEYAGLLQRLYPDHDNTAKALAMLGELKPGMAVTQKSRMTVGDPLSLTSAVTMDTRSTMVPNRINTDYTTSTAKIVSTAETMTVPDSVVVINEDTLKDGVTNSETALTTETSSSEIIGDAVIHSISEYSSDDGRLFHIVKPKENLYRISLKYNVKVRKLLEWNGLKDASSIQIGTKLWVKDS